MAERVRDVSDHDLALYRAIVGPTPLPPPVAAARVPGWRRRLMALAAPGARLDQVMILARRRLAEALKRFGMTTRF